jgi:hypothetical protein
VIVRVLVPAVLGAAFLGYSGVTIAGSVPIQARRDYSTLDVCQLIPGDVVARALGGKLSGTRGMKDKAFSRCSYTVVPPGSDKQSGYVIWVQPVEDFAALKKYIESPITALTGLGDGAYMFQDNGDKRFKINVLKKGDLMFQATADSAESARKVAEAVFTHLSKKAP